MKFKLKSTIASCVAIFACCALMAQTKVSTLKEVLPYLKKDNVHVVVKPGTYRITSKEARKIYDATIDIVEGQTTHALFLVEGNNSIYDFTDVVVEVETSVFNAYPDKHRGLHELHVVGSNNVVKGLKLVDVGSLLDAPNHGCVNVVVDGAGNRIEDVEVNSRGSYPYGYGELFGKGGKNIIRHRKHSACLVRGYENHIKGCTIIHRAYGHCLFMQAADRPIIEGCYIEGDVVSTDVILAEQGTGSAADKVKFMTYFGYKTPPGHVIAAVEEGIRAYDGGNTIIDGKRYKRGTSNVTVRDCYVKNARAGVTLTHAQGTTYVENTTAVGCNRGYAVSSGGRIVNCVADVKNGPAFGVDYARNTDITADITIIPHDGDNGNGTTHAAIIIGRRHNITLRKGKGLKVEKGLEINLGGDNKTIGLLAKDENYLAEDITLVNETGYPVIIDDNASSNTVTSKGKVTDNGTNNKIIK